MTIDANGEARYDFWEGIRMNGRLFKSDQLFRVCEEFGDAQVIEACHHLGCFPYAEDLAAIKAECQRQEDSYV